MYNYNYNNTYDFVDGVEGAKAYQVRPNSMMLLMDSQQPICYKKQTNSMGQTIAFEIYDLVPHKQETQDVTYVTKAEFNEAIAQLKSLIGGKDNESV